MLANVVMVALDIKIELRSNAAVLEKEQEPQASYPQSPHPQCSRSCSPIVDLPLDHP